jgi:hypothetical protein
VKQFPADWNGIYKRSAGIIRNIEMAKYAHALLALWDGKSKGTEHMILEMHRQGKPVHVYLVKEKAP